MMGMTGPGHPDPSRLVRTQDGGGFGVRDPSRLREEADHEWSVCSSETRRG